MLVVETMRVSLGEGVEVRAVIRGFHWSISRFDMQVGEVCLKCSPLYAWGKHVGRVKSGHPENE